MRCLTAIFWGVMVVLLILGCSSSTRPENDGNNETNDHKREIICSSAEKLCEMFKRKERRATAAWGAQYLEDPATYQWRPETFMYRDVNTGHEVWKLSDGPLRSTLYHNDIGVSPWNADGSKLAFTAWKRSSQAYSQSAQQQWNYIQMTADTKGSRVRPTVEGARRVGGNYFHWSPQEPSIYYEVGETHLNTAAQNNVLYRLSVDDDGVITRQAILTLPASAAQGTINKMISADGRRIIIEQSSRYFPITITSSVSAALDVPNGYSMDRNFGMYGNMAGGAVSNYHDQYMAGLGDQFFAMASGTSTWWLIKTVGSAPDGGAFYSGNDGNNNFQEVSPVNHGALGVGNITSPWVEPSEAYNPTKTAYWSHFVPDRWGRYALFSNSADDLPGEGDYYHRIGPGIWDIQNRAYVVPSFGGGAQHHDWHGFTDWTVSSGGVGDYPNQVIYAQNLNDADSQITVNSAYTRYDGGTSYSSLVRPAQSPDGTKVAWHSEFLNGADAVDIFWSVVMYPYPPTNLAATGNSGSVIVSFLPPKYTERRWIDPSTGKIDELSGEVLYAREIKEYHVWRSTSATEGWSLLGTVSATYANDLTTNTLKPTTGGGWVRPTNRIIFNDEPGNGTFYYAITSMEHSLLESDELSEILEVTVSAGSVVAASIVQPKGQRWFWTASPSAPRNLSVQSGSASGHYHLRWTEPANPKLRYYNIYYSGSNRPSATQAERIASVPVGSSEYLDWLAAQSGASYYGITSVDRYGNESSIIYP